MYMSTKVAANSEI